MSWPVGAIALLTFALPLLSTLSPAARRADDQHAAIAAGAVAASFGLSASALWISLVEPPARNALLGIDRLGALMLVLVTGVSTIVHVFAARYMDSDARYARFFRRLSITSACVIVVVIANDLVLLAVGWIGVSLGLYALQTHYRERPPARAAATLMRHAHLVGDVALVGACAVLGFASHGTRIDLALAQAGGLSPVIVSTVVGLVAVAAFSKSAQLPLHRWLPDTMEAPTPVSALMHAGIVNAGGFVLARFSPLVTHAPAMAVVIFLVGAATALWGAGCMLVRSDVKRGLAYSTVSQMGYMTLQCGLGAFSAAVFHLVAHGLFKATLFLGSGYAIHDHKREMRAPGSAVERVRRPWVGAAAALTCVPIGVLIDASPIGRALPAYGWVLLAFATLTCMQTTFAIVKRGTATELCAAAVVVLAALPAYGTAIGWFDRFLAADVAATMLLVPAPLAGATVAVFAGMLVLSWGLIRIPASLRNRVYVWLLSERLPLGLAR